MRNYRPDHLEAIGMKFLLRLLSLTILLTPTLVGRMTTMIRGGRSKEEITKMLVDEFGWSPQGLTIKNSLDGLMAELK
jgi:hypothetical protein